MGKLVCEICGGSLIMNADNVAECESCGMKYAKEKVASMVKIDGAVEITQGEAEKERLLKNAETFVNLGKHIEAEDLCKKIVDEYPDDYRGWYLRFKNVVLAMDCNIDLYGHNYNTFMLKEANMYLETSLKLAPDKTSLEKEAILFWQDALQKGNADLGQFHNRCSVLGDVLELKDNHIVKKFVSECDLVICNLVKQLNDFPNKTALLNLLDFQSVGNWEEWGDELVSIQSFYCRLGNEILVNGIVMHKEFDGLTFWGGKTKYKYVEIPRNDMYSLHINSYNDLKKLSETVNQIVNEV